MRLIGAKSIMQMQKRPVFLVLHQLRLPLTGLVSIAHRITGIMLFLHLPLMLYLLQHSLASAGGFAEVQRWLQSWPARLEMALVAWWLAHHLFAGLRHLLLDMDIGVGLAQARRSAVLVLVGGGLVLLLGAVGGL
jgi:succinate dehydrogenase / fumarate reductase cytochrome b subunit